MNRSNIGNQVTNGMQVLSVAGFTGGNYVKNSKKQRLADASSALNNMTEDEVSQVGQMRADNMREELRQHQNKVDGMFHLSDEEQQSYGDKRADDLRKYINGNDEEEENKSVDELVSGISSMNTPQSESLAKSINTNSEYLRKRNLGRDVGTGRFVSTKPKKEGDE